MYVCVCVFFDVGIFVVASTFFFMSFQNRIPKQNVHIFIIMGNSQSMYLIIISLLKRDERPFYRIKCKHDCQQHYK